MLILFLYLKSFKKKFEKKHYRLINWILRHTPESPKHLITFYFFIFALHFSIIQVNTMSVLVIEIQSIARMHFHTTNNIRIYRLKIQRNLPETKTQATKL